MPRYDMEEVFWQGSDIISTLQHPHGLTISTEHLK